MQIINAQPFGMGGNLTTMRLIKFRAARTDSMERFGKIMFVEGYLVKTPITAEWNDNREGGHFFDSGGHGRYCIITDSGVAHEIDVETLGQLTGFFDKSGKEIYEGDILQIEAANHMMVNVICEFGVARRKMLSGYEVDIPSFYFKRDDLLSFPITDNWNHKHDLEMLEVIGNIYENAELIGSVSEANQAHD